MKERERIKSRIRNSQGSVNTGWEKVIQEYRGREKDRK